MGLESLPMNQRAILGCSLSALVALRMFFLHPGLFGKFVLGSPSLPLAPDIARLEQSEAKSYAVKDILAHAAFLFVAGAAEGRTDRGVSIPAMAQQLAIALRK